MTARASYCDECKHFADRYDAPDWRTVCMLGHKPRFFMPQTMSQAHSRDWGFKRRCEDFAALPGVSA